MDPVSVGLLSALAGGAGGEIGKQAWTGLSALVRRPFRRDDRDTGDMTATGSGERELTELERAPADSGRAQALSTVLAMRAAVDTGFRAGLEQWHEQARSVRSSAGDTSNEISGGTFHGPVLTGRDFSRISFTTPPQPQPDSDPGRPES